MRIGAGSFSNSGCCWIRPLCCLSCPLSNLPRISGSKARCFYQLPVTFLFPPSKGQLPVQDWLLLLYQETAYLSFRILHLSVQRFHAVIAACDGVDCAADFLLQGELRQPERGQIFHAEIPALVEVAVVPWVVGRQGLQFQIQVWIGKVIFRWLVMVCLFPFLDFCQQIRVDFMFKLLVVVHKYLLIFLLKLVFNFLIFLPRCGVLVFLLMLHLVDVVMNRPELFRVGIERRKLRLNVLAVLLQQCPFFAPCGDGQLAVLEVRFLLALCHVESPQLVIVFGFVFLPGFLKSDGFQLVRSGLALSMPTFSARRSYPAWNEA